MYMYVNPLDRLRNLCHVQNRIKGSEIFSCSFLFVSVFDYWYMYMYIQNA